VSITAALPTVRGDELDEPRAKAAYVWLVGELGACAFSPVGWELLRGLGFSNTRENHFAVSETRG